MTGVTRIVAVAAVLAAGAHQACAGGMEVYRTVFLAPSLASLTDFGPCGQRDYGKHDGQAQQGKTVVCDFEETLGDVAGECCQALGEFLGRCHSSSFLGVGTVGTWLCR